MKRILRILWKLAKPVREALAARFDQHLDRHLECWFARFQRVHAEEKETVANMQLVSDALVRELVRLQSQVQRLQEAVERPSFEGDRIQPAAKRRHVA